MKWVRALGWALAALLALLLVALAAAWWLFDAAAVRGQAEKLVSERTGRQLVIGKDPALSFFPTLAIELHDIRLAERGQPSAPFASVEQVRLGVRFMPLLQRRIEAEEILLVAPAVRLVRHADGRLNIDDLLAADASAAVPPPAAPVPAPETAAAPLQIALAGLRLERGRVSYLDAASGKESVISDLGVRLGAIGPRSAGRFVVGATATIDGKPLRVDAEGDYLFGDRAAPVTLSAVAAKVNGGLATVSDLSVQVRVASLRTGTGGSLAADGVDIRAGARLPDQQMEVALTVPALVVGDQRLTVAAYQGSTTVRGAGLPGGAVTVAVDGSAAADFAAGRAEGQGRFRVDDSTARLKWALPRLAPWQATFALDVDRIDVDRYRPAPSPTGAAPAPATKEASNAGTPPPASASRPSGATADSPVNLSWLRGMDLAGTIQIGALRAHGLKLANLRADVVARNAQLAVAPLSAELYGGRVSGALNAAAAPQRIGLQASLDGVDLQPLLIDLTGKDMLAGRGRVTLDLATGGATVSAFTRALQGTAAVSLRDGAVKGINLAKSLREAKARLGGSETVEAAAAREEKTDFSELQATFRIAQGVARNDDFSAKAPFFRVTGAGSADLPARTLDYLAKANVVNTSTGQDGKSLDHLRGLTIPVRLFGPFEQLRYRLEFGQLAKEAAKERLKEKLGEKLGVDAATGQGAKEAAKARLQEKLDGKLKGLLGR